MATTSSDTTAVTSIEDLARAALEEASANLGADVVLLDTRNVSDFTDYFVIATTLSHAHLRGVLRHLDTALGRMGNAGRERAGHSLRRAPDDSGWVLVDLGNVVIHLMTDDQRRFYELERLWFRSPAVFRDGGSGRGTDTQSK